MMPTLQVVASSRRPSGRAAIARAAASDRRCGRPRAGSRRGRRARAARPESAGRWERPSRSRRAARRGRRRSRSRCVRRPTSKWLGAPQPVLLRDGEQQLDARAADGRSAVSRRASSIIAATAALLSAPRIAGLRLRHAPSTPLGLHRRDRRERCRGGRRAAATGPRHRGCGRAGCRRPTRPPPRRRPPRPRAPSLQSSRVTQSAQARSCPDGLSIRQSASNVRCRRSRSASPARLTTGERRSRAVRPAPPAPRPRHSRWPSRRVRRRRSPGTAAPAARAAT